MNNKVSVKLTSGLESYVARILRDILDFEIISEPADTRYDLIVHSGETGIGLVVECKARANAATARQAVDHANDLGSTPLLVVAGETTASAREILQSNNVAFVDGLGNARIALPGLVYRLAGQSQKSTKAPPTRISGKAGRIAQTLLVHPGRQWHINELSAKTDVSPGFVHRVVARLTAENIMESEGDGPAKIRTVIDQGALLDLWAEEQHDKVERTVAYQLAPSPQQLLGELTSALVDAGIDYAATGPAAANLVAPFVTGIPVTDLWISDSVSPREILERTPAEAVDIGHNVAFLQTRDDGPLRDRQQIDGIWITNDFRLYVDLRNNPRRGAEQADHLRRERIGI